MATTHADASPRTPYASPAGSRPVDFRRKRARRAALRHLFVWSAVAALALIAQVVAPAAAT
ncbi:MULTISPECIES: hypothetical protein [unclassified Lysobacter]|uniref:hypothetical protein n=1 Tax=unclassified Lysobacter TaxID=2635362 RepID=UPI001C244D31|nr:hypothetical protein [Lysobacter sp. MMG2]MBU8976409.1 hypothetical protein [Lysobacter sp. MMG2]